jgi:hypothetical protein
MLDPNYVNMYITFIILPISIPFAHLIINMNMLFNFENKIVHI